MLLLMLLMLLVVIVALVTVVIIRLLLAPRLFDRGALLNSRIVTLPLDLGFRGKRQDAPHGFTIGNGIS